MDRQLALWTIERGGKVGVRILASNVHQHEITEAAKLPDKPFRVTQLILTTTSHDYSTDADLLPLRQLSELNLLAVNWSGLTPDGISGLDAIVKLRYLILVGQHKSPDAWNALVNLQELDNLELQAVQPSSIQIASLRRLTKLRSLKMGFEPKRVIDSALARVNEVPTLIRLELRGISNDGLESVAKVPNLETLNLTHCTITDAGLAQLANLKNLRTLSLKYTRTITESGISELQKALPNCKIDWDRGTESNPDTKAAGQK